MMSDYSIAGGMLCAYCPSLITPDLGGNGMGRQSVGIDPAKDTVGAREITPDFGCPAARNGGTGARSIMTNVRDVRVRAHCDFCLEAESRSLLRINKVTYLKNTTNLIEIRCPGSDRLFVVPRSERSGEYAPFAPLGDMLLDFCHCPVVGAR
jgi:hypothetical protein